MNYLTPADIADELGVTRRTVYEWLLTGQLEGLRAGRSWRVTREALDAFMRQRKPDDDAAKTVTFMLPALTEGGVVQEVVRLEPRADGWYAMFSLSGRVLGPYTAFTDLEKAVTEQFKEQLTAAMNAGLERMGIPSLAGPGGASRGRRRG